MAVHWHSVDAYALTKADRRAIKDSFSADRDKLTAIIDEAAWTNAKRDAAHKDAAHQFIEYLLQPAVAAKNSDFVNYANANKAATPLVNADLRNDTNIYPTPEVAARLQPSLAKSAEFTRALNRSWTRFVTGR